MLRLSLARKPGRRQRVAFWFAYPYGHVSDFLRDEFFPEHVASDFRGALSTGGDYFTQQSCRWAIPRFVCGEHWQAPEGLEAILESAKPSDEVFGNRSFSSDVTGDPVRLGQQLAENLHFLLSAQSGRAQVY